MFFQRATSKPELSTDRKSQSTIRVHAIDLKQIQEDVRNGFSLKVAICNLFIRYSNTRFKSTLEDQVEFLNAQASIVRHFLSQRVFDAKENATSQHTPTASGVFKQPRRSKSCTLS